jgi:hypothetical protein
MQYVYNVLLQQSMETALGSVHYWLMEAKASVLLLTQEISLAHTTFACLCNIAILFF